jgi:hypothetical protein
LSEKKEWAPFRDLVNEKKYVKVGFIPNAWKEVEFLVKKFGEHPMISEEEKIEDSIIMAVFMAAEDLRIKESVAARVDAMTEAEKKKEL